MRNSIPPLILEYLFGTTLSSMGFRELLTYWSFAHRIAKPSPYGFEQIAERAHAQYGIAPHEILYIGNDVRNDIIPAKRVGFKTCLYCGDVRSLKLHPKSDARDIRHEDGWIADYGELLTLLD